MFLWPCTRSTLESIAVRVRRLWVERHGLSSLSCLVRFLRCLVPYISVDLLVMCYWTWHGGLPVILLSLFLCSVLAFALFCKAFCSNEKLLEFYLSKNLIFHCYKMFPLVMASFFHIWCGELPRAPVGTPLESYFSHLFILTSICDFLKSLCFVDNLQLYY